MRAVVFAVVNDPVCHCFFGVVAIFSFLDCLKCNFDSFLIQFYRFSVTFLGNGLFVNVEDHQDEVLTLIFVNCLVFALVVLFPNLVNYVLDDVLGSIFVIFVMNILFILFEGLKNLWAFHISLSNKHTQDNLGHIICINILEYLLLMCFFVSHHLHLSISQKLLIWP